MKWPGRAAPSQRSAVGPGDHPHLRARRVHRLDGGHEQRIDAAGGGERAIARQIPGIARQILVGPELKRIHEDAHDHRVGPPPGLVHQREVSLVQIAHGGNEADPAAGGALTPGPRPEVGNRWLELEQAHSKLCSLPGYFPSRTSSA